MKLEEKYFFSFKIGNKNKTKEKKNRSGKVLPEVGTFQNLKFWPWRVI